jgi:hypothetical protein
MDYIWARITEDWDPPAPDPRDYERGYLKGPVQEK